MDNLTHSLLGLTLSRAGLNRLAPRSGWLLLLAANAPDIDTVAGLAGSTRYLGFHRGWTHSVVLAPVVALLPLAIWWLLARKLRPGVKQWLGAYVVSLAGVASHILLDWTNVYGIRLLLPFDATWLRLDWVNIVDIWVWALLGVAVFAPLLTRLVNSEIGARSGPGRAGACAILVLLALYIAGRSVSHDRAVATLEARIYSGETPRTVAVVPGPANPLRWRGIVETDSAWHVVDVNLRRDFDPDSGRLFYKPQRSAALDRARESETARVFLNFASFPVWSVTPTPDQEGSTTVLISDLRFGLPEEKRFTATIVLDPAGRIVREGFEFGTLGTD